MNSLLKFVVKNSLHKKGVIKNNKAVILTMLQNSRKINEFGIDKTEKIRNIKNN